MKHPAAQLVIARLGIERSHPVTPLKLGALPAQQQPPGIAADMDRAIPTLRIVLGQPAAEILALRIDESARVS